MSVPTLRLVQGNLGFQLLFSDIRRDLLRESARMEYEQARFETDPEVVRASNPALSILVFALRICEASKYGSAAIEMFHFQLFNCDCRHLMFAQRVLHR